MDGKLKTAVKLLKENKSEIPYAIFRNITKVGLTRIIPDKLYLKIAYKLATGHTLNLDNPQTFNEKLQWLKLYDRRPEYITMVDKYRVREYIADTIGEEYLIPLLGVWENANDIDFDTLPNQFVLKCNHDSGSVIICKDKSKLDKKNTIRRLNRALRNTGYWFGREWPYKNVKPCIVAEKYMTDLENSDLPDYKVHNFNGIPKVILVCSQRFTQGGLHEDFYTPKWEKLDLRRPNHPNVEKKINPPDELEQMLQLSEKLSNEIPFARTDFYIVNGKLYFGEITLYPSAGFDSFSPETWDRIFGDWIRLPEKSGGYILKKGSICIWLHEAQTTVANSQGELRDYKFFCFSGEVKCFKIDFDRYVEHRANYFSRDKKLLRFGEKVCSPDFNRRLRIPDNIDDMIALAEKLSKNDIFVRVDFYDVAGNIFFGELTYYPASGFGPFVPEEWDRVLGDWVCLPDVKIRS